jgi:hypothetical protein
MVRCAVIALVLGGCASRGAVIGPASPAMSYEAHIAEADKLEKEARVHDDAAEIARQRGTNYQCDTSPEQEQLTIGGERVGERGTRVCDDVALSDRRRHERESKKLKQAAEEHRSSASALLDAERKACAGFSISQLQDTPLGRARPRLDVMPSANGVDVTMAAGPGVAVEALQREMACHRARAALYEPGEYMGHDPSLVPATRLSIARSGGGITFTISGDDQVARAAARSLAESLKAE